MQHQLIVRAIPKRGNSYQGLLFPKPSDSDVDPDIWSMLENFFSPSLAPLQYVRGAHGRFAFKYLISLKY
jgi:hypothetical protein